MRDSFVPFLDRLHAAARSNPALARLAVVSRVLLAIAFVPTGMVKLLGERFTSLPTTTTIGFFFEAMYRTGPFWRCIGLAQVVAGTLLLIPPLSTLGAVLFFPIMLNVFLITVSLRFQGTPFVTGMMLLASIFLLCWDYDRLKLVVFAPTARPATPALSFGSIERVGIAICGLAGITVLLVTRSMLPRSVLMPALATGVVGSLLVLAVWGRLFARSLRESRSSVRFAGAAQP